MEASQLFYHSEFTRVLVNRSWKHSNLQIAENYWQIWKQLSNANSANSLGFFPLLLHWSGAARKTLNKFSRKANGVTLVLQKEEASESVLTGHWFHLRFDEIWHLCWDGPKNPACLNIIPNIFGEFGPSAHLVGVNVCTCSARWHNTHASTWQHKGPQEVQF